MNLEQGFDLAVVCTTIDNGLGTITETCENPLNYYKAYTWDIGIFFVFAFLVYKFVKA